MPFMRPPSPPRLCRLVAERAIEPAHQGYEQLEIPAQAIDQARARDHTRLDRGPSRERLELQPLGRGVIGRELAGNPEELRLLAQAVESPPESRCAREPRQSGGLAGDRLADAQERGPRGHPDAAGHEARGGGDVKGEYR